MGREERGGAHVYHVCHALVDLRAVLLVEGHAPEAVELDFAGFVEFGPEGVGRLWMKLR